MQNATRGGVFFAVRQSNFSITGGGTVNGGGAKWNNDARRAHFLEFFFCSDQGRKRVIQRRFNVSVPRASVLQKASTLRERSER